MIRAARPGSGRPTKYQAAHAVNLREYFENTVKRIDQLITADQRENLPFPSIAAWCRKVGVERNAPRRWEKYPEFKEAADFARQVQRDLNELARVGGLKFTLKEPEA